MDDSKLPAPQQLPEHSFELRELLDELTESIKKWRQVFATNAKWVEAIKLAHLVESSKDEAASLVLPTLQKLAEDYRELVTAKANPGEMPHIRRGVENLLSQSDRQHHRQLISTVFETMDAIVELSDRYQMHRYFEGEAWQAKMQAAIREHAKAFSLSRELIRHRNGISSEPPVIPPQLAELVIRLADTIPETTDREEEDEDENDEDESLTSAEIKSEILKRAATIVESCESLVSLYENLRRDIQRRLDSQTVSERSENHGEKVTRAATSRAKKGVYNLRMIEELQRDPKCGAWSVEQWGLFLDCAKSTVHGQPTWKTIMRLREQSKEDRFDRQ